MQKYRKYVEDGYIRSIAIGEYGEEITESEYAEILDIIRNAPSAPEGYWYRLANDGLQWVLCELPPEPESQDIDDTEAFGIIFGGAE